MTRDQVLTKGWNNALTAALGVPMIAYVVAAVATDNVPSRIWFIGLFLIGAVY